MIVKLYKYMRLRESFFDNPVFTATPWKSLNDPFEANVQDYQIENIVNHWIEGGDRYSLKDEKIIEKEGKAPEVKYTKESFESEMDRLGVVSFTEDYRNLLMWAHYADEHRGMVVEISSVVTWLTNAVYSNPHHHGLRRFEYGPEPVNYDEMPQRVVYRQDRPLFEFPCDVEPIYDSQMIKSILLSKGDSWIYEKEHRSILPLENADYISTIYSEELAEIVSESKFVRISGKQECQTKPILGERCYISFEVESDSRLVRVTSHEYMPFEPEELRDIRFSIYLYIKYNSVDSRFLYKVDTRFISGVYFGCNSPKKTVDSIVSKVRSAKIFSNEIYLKRANISKERYALEFSDL